MRTSFSIQLTDLEGRLDGHLRDVVTVLDGLGDVLAEPSARRAESLQRTGASVRRTLRDLEVDLITLTACQAPVASDLSRILSLLQVSQHACLIGNQFRLIAEQLLSIDPAVQRGDANLPRLTSMAGLAGAAVESARAAFAARDPGGVGGLESADDAIDRLNREVFIAAHARQTTGAQRELGIRHLLIARSLERIGDNAVKIAEQGAHLAEVDPHRLTVSLAPSPEA